ncbi:peptide chain release factor N(5)-glutamine methyltransferase [Hyphomicrobium sp. CS1GBMeth3]|uniref:peptide chain release factor N(5)-glutamine methyltransferase n=1 Tax=Hyphomicrobium sp. CS1GBMeth3 TaxID=1892845 RepID=UPI000AC3CBE7|nr:peptide chain release factor N(5)-glutamine methyltransferase [Hyphomicrobium sp. CS1GBMeth3]
MAPKAYAAGLQLAGVSVRDAMAAVARSLEASGIDGAVRDARLLVLEALGIAATDLLRDPERRLSVDEAARLAAFARRRGAHEPVSRIVGTRGFYGRTFKITPATLDPRPCTETVVEAALEIADREGWRETPIRILDVGTGTGALLLTLLAELPKATGVGTDISEAALAVARENASMLGVAGRATFLTRRTLDGIEGTFHLLVSNPPYIPTREIAALDLEVREYDPFTALDGGADGLDIYRALAHGLQSAVPEGWAVFEVGAGQAKAVAQMLRSAAGAAAPPEIKIWKDLGHHERCVAVRTHC